ncbi:PARN [Bugula neritina]|uniref:Poly(A)-specific ribonuclease PARN n=1 Tax=Bugula neritina TaxID=10212 RepID=A0A7J7J4G0_BUGNE|nr:PARN [Bugula neritina]
MEVSRSNFKEHVDTVLKDIKTCSFISCDGEFTGIRNDNFRCMPFDTIDERYEKLKQGNMKYLMCQVGLSFFFLESDGSYTVKPYNFYILPSAAASTDDTSNFVCQTSCINFLTSHGFDFNKVFRDGIPFLKPAEESKALDRLMESHEKKQKSTFKSDKLDTPTSIKPVDEKFLQQTVLQIKEFLRTAAHGDKLNLESTNSYRRKLLYGRLGEIFGDTVTVEVMGIGKQRPLIVTKVDAERKKEIELEALNKKLRELEDAVGFSQVVKEISISGKILVGHNMLLDVMYLISQFLAQLPNTYKEFKPMANEIFPKLMDTKVISSTYLFKDNIEFNSLEEMNKILHTSLYQQIDCDYTNADAKFHDAAYDSFVTGKCFAIMSKHIGSQASPPVQDIISNSSLLNPFLNKLFINGLPDISYMNLSGAEAKVDRDHMYHITFPPSWQRSDICQVFYPADIYIKWIDTKSAMVTLQHRSDNKAAVLSGVTVTGVLSLVV